MSHQSLRSYMFKNKSVFSFKFPTQISKIDAYIFEYSKVYCDLIIPSTISRIYAYAFKDMGGNCKIILSSSLTQIDSYTFLDCTAIKTISIPLNIKKIYPYGFLNCSLLEDLYIPHNTIDVNKNSFEGCNSLKRVLAPDNVISVLGGGFLPYQRMSDIPLEMRLRKNFFWKIKHHHSLCIREEKELIYLVLLCGERLDILPPELWILIMEFIEFGNFIE